MDFEIRSNLKIKAATTAARSLWDNPLIKEAIIASCDFLIPLAKGEVLPAITKKLLDTVRKENLPEPVELDFINAIIFTGKKIFSWAEHLQKEFNLKSNHIDSICWTDIGTIDQVKIFQKWISDPEFVNLNPLVVYNMASQCAQLDFLKFRFQEIKKFLERDENSYNRSIFNLGYVLPYTLLYFDENLKIYKDLQSKLKAKKISKELNMFETAIWDGCDVAAKYYWDKLSESEQQENIRLNAIRCLFLYEKCQNNFVQENYIEILIFLLTKMSEQQREEIFVNDKSPIWDNFLSVWPVQKLVLPLFEKYKEFFSPSSYINILKSIVMHLAGENDLGLSDHENFYYQAFVFVWKSFPKNVKDVLITMPKSSSTYDLFYVVMPLFKIFHVNTLKLITNDKDIGVHTRNLIINFGKEKYEELLNNKHFEALNSFINEIFNSDVEKLEFKSRYVYYYLIKNDHFDIAIELLNWQANLVNNNDREELIKSEMDCEKICHKFIQDKKYDSVDHFLEWVFDSEEKRETFKKNFKSDDFVKDQIYFLWTRDYDLYFEVEGQSIEFFKWISKSEDEANQFKKNNLIVDYKCLVEFCKKLDLQNTNKSEIIGNFLNFCEMFSKKVTELKKNFLENFNNLFASDIEVKHDLAMIEYLLDWSTDRNDEGKATVIEILMSSVDIVLFWDKIVVKSHSELIIFYNKYIKKSQNIVTLKNELDLRHCSYDWDKFNFELDLICLKKLEQGDDINLDDVNNFHEDYYDKRPNRVYDGIRYSQVLITVSL